MFCCSTVCGLWSSRLGKGHRLLFFSQCYASHPLPTTCVCIKGGASRPTRPNSAIIARPPLLVHSSALSQIVWVCRELGSLSFPSPLSLTLSLSLLPTHRLSADVARGRSGLWPSGPCVCVCVCCSPLPSQRHCVIGGICVCLCLPVPLDAGGNRMREDQL